MINVEKLNEIVRYYKHDKEPNIDAVETRDVKADLKFVIESMLELFEDFNQVSMRYMAYKAIVGQQKVKDLLGQVRVVDALVEETIANRPSKIIKPN